MIKLVCALATDIVQIVASITEATIYLINNPVDLQK